MKFEVSVQWVGTRYGCFGGPYYEPMEAKNLLELHEIIREKYKDRDERAHVYVRLQQPRGRTLSAMLGNGGILAKEIMGVQPMQVDAGIKFTTIFKSEKTE